MPELKLVTVEDETLVAETIITVRGVKLDIFIEWKIDFDYVDDDGYPDPMPEDCTFSVGSGVKLDQSGVWHDDIHTQLQYDLWASHKVYAQCKKEESKKQGWY